jgi:hypothetical protein
MMSTQIQNGDNGRSAAYGSWGTMKNAFDGLAQGVHHRIDRTAFPGMSGGAQTALLAGLRFLGLINADGTPTPALHSLAVPDESARKKQIEAVLREKYADLFALDLTKVTPALLEERMGESYNVSGSTRDKAVRFFLQALEYLEIPVSPLFKKVAASAPGATRKRRAVQRPKAGGEPLIGDDEDEGDDDEPPAPGTSRTVSLRSGGTLTVSASMDVFKLSVSDRGFVFGLIDKLDEYEQGNTKA